MCGLSGFNGAKNPNIYKLKLLAVMNESRGKDSCGLFYNNKLYKGVRGATFDHSSATAFMGASKLTTVKHIKNNTTLFHTRQGTKGAANEQNAHPFAYFKNLEEQAAYDLGDHSLIPDFVGMMNGTLDDLFTANSPHAKRGYNWTYDMNDSRMLFDILFRQDYDYLKEYVGAAALAFTYPKETNTLCLWHGATIVDGFYVEERPLYYYNDKKDEGIYFSSLKEHLKVIAEGAEIISVPLNQIIKFHNGNIVDVIPVDRKIEKKAYTQSTYYQNGYNSYTNLPAKKVDLPKGNVRNLFDKKQLEEVAYNTKTGRYCINNKLMKGTYTVESALFGDVPLYFSDGYIMRSKRKKLLSEEQIIISDGHLLDYTGKPITPLNKDSNAVLFVPFDDQAFTVGAEGKIQHTYINPQATNGFYQKYRVMENTYKEFLKLLKIIIDVPTRIFSPFGMKMFLRDTYGYNFDLDSLYPGTMNRIITEIKTKIEGGKIKTDESTIDDILELPCSNAAIRSLIELIGNKEDADVKPQTWFNKQYGSIPDFTATIEENLNSCKLQNFLYDYLGQEADLVDYIRDLENPGTHWATSMKSFFNHTNWDKLTIFNKKFGTSCYTIDSADDIFYNMYGIQYDWNKSPGQNWEDGETFKWEELIQTQEQEV
jgi:predicted glutamine amidotransferase